MTEEIVFVGFSTEQKRKLRECAANMRAAVEMAKNAPEETPPPDAVFVVPPEVESFDPIAMVERWAR